MSREERFTPSGIAVKAVYTPEDLKDFDYQRDLGEPGEYPLTRGIYPEMYRKVPWSIMEGVGFDSAEDTRERGEFYLKEGAEHYLGGRIFDLYVDLPTHLGLDSDEPQIYGEIGKVGTHINSIKDMEELFGDISLEETHIGFIAFATAPMLFSMYVGVAEDRGLPLEKLWGAMNNNPLPGPIGENFLILPPRSHLRLMLDAVKFCLENTPNFRPLTISMYDMREAGITAVQELGIGLSQSTQILEEAKRRGISIAALAANMNFHTQLGSHFFEEIAKLRAARRMWSKIIREDFAVENPKSWCMKFLAQTAGSTLQLREPLNNVVRAALQALVGVFAGMQTIYLCSYDEAYATPTKEAARLAIRTQQIIREETGIPDVVDPLGGSYYLEWLTNRVEKEAFLYIQKIKERGGYIKALESGFLLEEVTSSAFKLQKSIEKGEKVIVGVNRYVAEEKSTPISIFRPNPETPKKALERIGRLKGERDSRRTEEALVNFQKALEEGRDSIRPMIEAFKSYTTLGEVVDVCKEVLGEYTQLL